jgi:hypothetical protein
MSPRLASVLAYSGTFADRLREQIDAITASLNGVPRARPRRSNRDTETSLTIIVLPNGDTMRILSVSTSNPVVAAQLTAAFEEGISMRPALQQLRQHGIIASL